MSDKPTFDPRRDRNIRAMLAEVTARDTPARSRPHRVAVLVSLILAALLISTGGVAIALNSVNFPTAEPLETATPTPSTTPTPTPTPTATETVAPAVTAEPTPAMDPSDPSSWIIGFDGVGPVAFDTPLAEVPDVLADTPYRLSEDSADWCPTKFYVTSDPRSAGLAVGPLSGEDAIGTILVTRSPEGSNDGAVPRTEKGITVGSSLQDLLAAYGPIERTGGYGESDDYYAITDDAGVSIVFRVYEELIDTIAVSSQNTLQSEYCG